ncbi:cytochrome b/b6 domain-containing protein [Nisaea denitrificans]|uniref:cytochrome b/b6 domain-containing protein n=1 Tax=Nisaea denitrificans TaxID=390877 RepID=UPI00040B3855|nr:cytochrome b/b6 domain-containing protein [Nisaea denitrificans]
MDGSRPVPLRLWDPVVCITHWTVAVCVLLNFTVVSEHSELHEWLGYVALAMVVLRMIWGVVGARRARFSSFPPSLTAARDRARTMLSPGRHGHGEANRSHNPLGALMVYGLWGMLFAVAGTGILLENFGEASQIGEVAEEVHEVTANLLVLMAALHVGGVLLESRLSGINLIRQMTWSRRGKSGPV